MSISNSPFGGKKLLNVRKSFKNVNGDPRKNDGIDEDDVERDSGKTEKEMQNFSPYSNRKSSRLQRKSGNLVISNMSKESEVKEFVDNLPASKKKGSKKVNLSAESELNVDVNHQEKYPMKEISKSRIESPRSMRCQKRNFDDIVSVDAIDKSLTEVVQNKEVKEFVDNLPASKKRSKKVNLSAESELNVGVNHQELDPMKEIYESGIESPRSMRCQKRNYDEIVNIDTTDKSLKEEVQNKTEDDAAKDIDAKGPPKQNKRRKKGRARYTPDPKDLPQDIIEQIPNMPKGWIRKIIVRKSGKSAGGVDIYITNPEGKTFRSLPDIAVYLVRTKCELKLRDFSFSRKPYKNMNLPKIEDAAMSLAKTENVAMHLPKIEDMALETVAEVEPSE